MTTTKQSTFGATLRTTILLASLSGLLVVIARFSSSAARGFADELMATTPMARLLSKSVVIGSKRVQ